MFYVLLDGVTQGQAPRKDASHLGRGLGSILGSFGARGTRRATKRFRCGGPRTPAPGRPVFTPSSEAWNGAASEESADSVVWQIHFLLHLGLTSQAFCGISGAVSFLVQSKYNLQ